MLSRTIENSQNQPILLEANFCFTLTKEGISLSFVSDSVEALLGYKAEDFLSKRISLKELIHPHDNDIADVLFANPLADTSDNFNLRIRQANQRIRCIKGHYTQRKNQLELFLRCAKSLPKITNDQTMMANFKAMMENTDDYIYFKDCNHVFTGASKTLVAITSPSDHWEDLLGLTDYDVFPEELADVYYRLEKQVFAGQSVAHEIQETLTKDGQKGWVDNRKYPIKDDTSQIIGLFGIARDITESKRAEATLRESEERIRTIGDNLQGAQLYQFRVAPDGCTMFTYVSSKIEELHECKPEDVLKDASLLFKRVHPADADEWQKLTAKSLRELSAYDHTVRIVRKSGEIRWHRMISKPKKLDDGSVLFDGVEFDVTESKQAEAQLRKSEEQFRNLYNEAPVGYFEYDLQGNITRVNHKHMRMLGYTAEEMIGQPCWKFIVDQVAREQIMAKLDGDRLLAAGLERTYRRKDGTTFPVLFEDKLLLDEGGHIKGIRTAIQDITELKRADKEKEKLQTQLNHAQKMESVGRLAGGVAHDFNNMLGVILGYTEMCLNTTEPSHPLFGHLQKIHKAAERSATLTVQLLAFARKQTVAPRVLDLNETVEGMLQMLRRLIGEDINLAWRPGRALYPVLVDPSQVDQILANLCVNSRDAIADTGKVTIETGNVSFDDEYCANHAGFVPGEFVMLAVSDDGCGMDNETLSHLFEPFFTTKELGKGTGLGLAMAYGIVKQNKGFINVYSEPDHGTTFKIYLPQHAAKVFPRTEPKQDQAAVTGGETILLVEDELDILKMSTMMLEGMGYTVIVAGTPGEAIRLAREHQGRIDLLMTDVVMPEMNGRDLARNIMSIYPDIKRLFMSGYTANVIAHHGVLDQGVHFLQKPFSMKNLATKIREALDRE
ncbi:MAG: PAS domain S-box protein [Desulforhopalus sp.]